MMQQMHTILETDWGYMTAIWTDIGLWELDFPVKDKPEEPKGEVTEAVKFWSEQLRQELNMYWRGFAVIFGVPIDWRGYTSFQAAVLKFTATISYGQTTSYGALAREINSPKAARAVGGALHRNRVPIVVPCHRVIGAKGTLTGFGGGIELKQALLLLESSEG
ncbi:MGMT family protein [Pelosinus sp. IPA-1]|uniref:methylated-DNA--[protein]-cysteine S-methyltransferase n=1 Tax=Pelosinus sp. IPA-1 TaxID=3029569 RepID=UPI0025560F86|nr:MGMT family protein [Pelosinus sp. IPA-1]